MGQEAVIAEHPKAFVGNMLDKTFDERLSVEGGRLMALGGMVQVGKDHGIAIVVLEAR